MALKKKKHGWHLPKHVIHMVDGADISHHVDGEKKSTNLVADSTFHETSSALGVFSGCSSPCGFNSG